MALPQLDRSALKVNQAAIVALVGVAFVLDWPALVAAVGAVLLAGTIYPPAALFQQLYRQVLRPAGLVRPRVEPDDPAPHRFAQGLGGSVLAVASVLFWLGVPTVGWALALLVVVLAGVNLVFDFCAGCFLYYQLGRAGLIGQVRARVR